MKHTRLPYLHAHLRNLNRSAATERQRFFRLYPIALLSCSFGFGYVIAQERSLKPLPVSVPSAENKTSPKAVSEQKRGVSAGIEATWIGETRSGESIREDGSGIRFTF